MLTVQNDNFLLGPFLETDLGDMAVANTRHEGRNGDECIEDIVVKLEPIYMPDAGMIFIRVQFMGFLFSTGSYFTA